MGDEAVEATEGYLEPDKSVFVARVDRTSTACEGERVELAVDTRRLHFFDIPTGETILR
jgi:hypothetical protein